MNMCEQTCTTSEVSSLLTKTRDSTSADSIKWLGSRQEEKKKRMSTKKPRKKHDYSKSDEACRITRSRIEKNETRRTNRREDEKRKEPMTRNPMRCTSLKRRRKKGRRGKKTIKEDEPRSDVLPKKKMFRIFPPRFSLG